MGRRVWVSRVDQVNLAPLDLDAPHDFETRGDRRERLGKPRPAHAGAPQTMMGIPVDRLAWLIPYVAPGIEEAAELQLAIDRTRAMFDEQRAEALIERAGFESRATVEPLVDAIHRIADAEARADHERATRGEWRAEYGQHGRVGYVYGDERGE